MNRMLRAAVAAAATVLVAGALGGCAFLAPPKTFSDTATVEEHILKDQALAPHYQIVLTREDRLDAMEILVEAAENATEAERTSSAATLQQRLKGSVGLSCTVTVTAPLGIERSQGKARRVIDKRPKS